MRTKRDATIRVALTLVIGIALLNLAACGEYTVPIADLPTRKIDRQLIGDWATEDEGDVIKIRELTESSFIVSFNGVLFRAYHTDLAGVQFLSVQELETENRSYSYLTYRLSPDGKTLYLRIVNKEVIPDDAADIGTVQNLLTRNLQNPKLLHPEAKFIRQQ